MAQARGIWQPQFDRLAAHPDWQRIEDSANDWSGNGPHIIDRMPFDKSSLLQRVLITRPEPGATQTADRLRAMGLVPVLAPVLAITPRMVQVPKDAAAILLTSRNAVMACPADCHDRPVFAVGAATASCATRAGFSHVTSADGDAAALAALVAATLLPEDGTLFLPAGQGQGFDLAASLRRSGFRVVRRVAYQAARIPVLPAAAGEHLRQRELAFALFYSGETARHFVRLLQAQKLEEAVRDVEAVSISEQAAVALGGLPWRRVRVALKPNQDAMLALLT